MTALNDLKNGITTPGSPAIWHCRGRGVLRNSTCHTGPRQRKTWARKERAEPGSRLLILVARLLKWQFQPVHRGASWRGSIAEQPVRIIRALPLSPSLKPWLPKAVAETHDDAVGLAAGETGLPVGSFPAPCPWSPEQLLDRTWWPDSGPADAGRPGVQP